MLQLGSSFSGPLIFGKYSFNFWTMYRYCFGQHLDNIWTLFGKYLDNIWIIFEQNNVYTLSKYCIDIFQKMFKYRLNIIQIVSKQYPDIVKILTNTLTIYFLKVVTIMAIYFLNTIQNIGCTISKYCPKRLLEMSSVAEKNRIIPAIDKLDN